MMDNTWRLAQMAEYQREDALARAEQYRLRKSITSSTKVQRWMQSAAMLLVTLLGLIIRPHS